MFQRAWVDDDPRMLSPVSSRGRWIGWGLVVQLVGVGIPVIYLAVKAHRMSVTGHVTAASVRLAWRSDAHTAAGLALLVAGAFIFAVGSIVMARPFVRRRATLLVAVPVAALLGVFVLGVVALLIAALVAGWLDFLEIFDAPSGGRRRRRNQAQNIPSGGG
jgi:NhaP-type Na+/H+ or K+/H+ antiporter